MNNEGYLIAEFLLFVIHLKIYILIRITYYFKAIINDSIDTIGAPILV